MKNKNEEYVHAMRHSMAHIMAEAVQDMFPEVQFGIGPVIENGFYYDFDLPRTLIPEDLPLIEKKMKHIIKQNNKFERQEVSKKEAMAFFKEAKEPYKQELISELNDGEITLYRSGKFVDLCKGPHVESTGKVGSFKLMSIAGAYWRGDEKNKMLQRIYGVAFETKEELDKYLLMIEEAKKRDHKKLGKELDLYSISSKVGAGLILWHPKLSIVREELELWWRLEHRRRGYNYVYSPHIGRGQLWAASGHLDFFKDSMYPPFKDKETGEEYYIKPMSCPFHVEIYKTKLHSYRDLPYRWNELGTCYRYEQSGEIHGMARPRGFTQDDAHIICTKEQFEDEYRKVIEFMFDMYSVFGFDKLKYYLAVRDPNNLEKYVGDKEVWDTAEKTIKKILEDKKIDYELEEGGAKFYGPALDVKIFDSLGREWQSPTIQLDMNLPTKFGMTYIGEDGQEHAPIMVHRTIFGSMERFCAILIEHFAGAFPLWLSPEQIRILPVSAEKHVEYAAQIAEQLKSKEFRVTVDSSPESVGKKIRRAELEKVNYMIIVGDKDIENQTVSIRPLKGEDMGALKLPDFIKMIKKERDNKLIK